MWLTVRNDRLFLVLLVALIALAWMSLWVWGAISLRPLLRS